jgi:hypothetical protein
MTTRVYPPVMRRLGRNVIVIGTKWAFYENIPPGVEESEQP